MLTIYAISALLAFSVHLGFSITYHVFIPAWSRNPFGRMIQFQSGSLCLVMGFVTIRAITGNGPGGSGATLIYSLMFLLLAFSGFWQIVMLSSVVNKSVVQGSINIRVEVEPPQEAEEDSSESPKI